MVCEFYVFDAVKGNDKQSLTLKVLYKAIPATVEELDAIGINDSVRDFVGTVAAVLDPDATAGLHGFNEDAKLRAIGRDGFEQDPVMDAFALCDEVVDRYDAEHPVLDTVAGEFLSIVDVVFVVIVGIAVDDDVNGNQKCSDFGNSECSMFGIKTTVLLASAVQ